MLRVGSGADSWIPPNKACLHYFGDEVTRGLFFFSTSPFMITHSLEILLSSMSRSHCKGTPRATGVAPMVTAPSVIIPSFFLFIPWMFFLLPFLLLFSFLFRCFFFFFIYQTYAEHLLCCCSIAKSWPALCNPTDCSTSGFPVVHYLPEFDQTHVHWVGDAIQPCHPLSW